MPAKEQKRLWARAMRKRPTASEKLLLRELRKASAGRYRIFAQRPLHGYILDIYIPAAKVAVEVDGCSHDGRERYDESRDAQLRAKAGVLTLRFSAAEVEANPTRVVEKIFRFCNSIRPH